jgi:hypothetical protein
MSLRPIPPYGDLMTLAEFVEQSRGNLIDWDGSGYFATKDGVSDIPARPSEAQHWMPERLHYGEFTHVMWFNK